MTNISIKSPLARDIDGIEAALDRAKTFVEAGADMTFVEAPRSEAEMGNLKAPVGNAGHQYGCYL